MDKTIWKFELETIKHQTIEMPIGAEILTMLCAVLRRNK